jgi:hypothetical protein
LQHEKVIAQQRKALDRLIKERGGDLDRDKENAGPAGLDEEERLQARPAHPAPPPPLPRTARASSRFYARARAGPHGDTDGDRVCSHARARADGGSGTDRRFPAASTWQQHGGVLKARLL